MNDDGKPMYKPHRIVGIVIIAFYLVVIGVAYSQLDLASAKGSIELLGYKAIIAALVTAPGSILVFMISEILHKIQGHNEFFNVTYVELVILYFSSVVLNSVAVWLFVIHLEKLKEKNKTKPKWW